MSGIKIIRPQSFVILTILYVAFGLFLFLIQKKLIYHPYNESFAKCNERSSAKVIQDDHLKYLYIEGGDALAVVFHGNAGSACDRMPYADFFQDHGYSTILMEYPGYSLNDGSPSMTRTLDTLPFLDEHIRKLGKSKTVIVGESLGSGVAANYAMRFNHERLILITPFDSLRNVVQNRIIFYPAGLLLTEKYDTLGWSQQTKTVRIIAAKNDEVVPIERAKNLFDHLPTEDKKIIVMEGVGHNSIYGSNDFWKNLEEMLL